MMPQAKGSSPAAMVPLLSRHGGPHACHPLALCRWVPKGSECQDSPAPQPPTAGQGLKGTALGGEGGQRQWRKGGRTVFLCLHWRWSFSQQKTGFYSRGNFFLQLKPHIRPHDASQCNGEQLGLCSSEQSPQVKLSSPGAAAAVGGPELTVHSLISLSCQKWARCPASAHVLSFNTSPSANDFRAATEKNSEKIKTAVTEIHSSVMKVKCPVNQMLNFLIQFKLCYDKCVLLKQAKIFSTDNAYFNFSFKGLS